MLYLICDGFHAVRMELQIGALALSRRSRDDSNSDNLTEPESAEKPGARTAWYRY